MTQTYLPDTNLLIHYARNNPLYDWVKTYYPLAPSDLPPILSIAIVGEILAFADQSKWGQARRQQVEAFIARSIVVPIEGDPFVRAYVEIENENRRVGRKMGDNDIWIAATARVTGATLLTTDKDFDHLHPVFIQRVWINPNTR